MIESGLTAGLSHKYKAILIRIPKTATTSILAEFEITHAKHINWKETYEMDKDYLHYTKFTVVRNPWDRFVSEYFFSKMLKSYYYDNTYKNDKSHPLYHKFKNMSFKDVVKDIYNNTELYFKYSHYIPQYKYIYDSNMNLMVDLVLRFESLEEDIKKINSNIILPKINIGEHLPYNYYYDEETKNMIGEIYKKDIELLKYEY